MHHAAVGWSGAEKEHKAVLHANGGACAIGNLKAESMPGKGCDVGQSAPHAGIWRVLGVHFEAKQCMRLRQCMRCAKEQERAGLPCVCL